MFFLSGRESSSDHNYWVEGISTQMISTFGEFKTCLMHCEITYHFFGYDNNFKCNYCNCRIDCSQRNPHDECHIWGINFRRFIGQ